MRIQDGTKHCWLFDIDGVLCEPQQTISQAVTNALNGIDPSGKSIFLVTGNTYTKAVDMAGNWQIFANNADELREDGALVWQDTETPPLPKGLQGALNCAHYGTPLKNFGNNSIEWRGPRFVNYCPIGRFATKKQRSTHKTSWREGVMEFLSVIEGIEYSIGGQVSVDIYSKGADKSRAGKWLNDNGYTFTFIGDKTSPGGNDYPLAEYCRLHPENKCLTSTGPKHTLELIDEELRDKT